MPLRPLAIRPKMDNLQVNDEGRQVLLVQQPSHAQNILLPSAQVQQLPNQVTATTQQQIQGGGLWFGATQYNGMYFQPNQTMAQAMLPINAAPPRYVSPIYTQAQIGNGNYALLEMNPATALFPRQNYVMHPSSFIPSNDSMLATGTPHLDPTHCGVMLHGRSNLGMPRVDSRTMDSFYVQDKMSTGRHGTFQDLLHSGSSRTAVESILTEGMNMLPEKNPNGYRPSSTYQISNEGVANNYGADALHVTPDSPSRLVVDDSGYASSESSLYDVDSDDEDDAFGFQDKDNIERHNLAASSECPVNNICNASEQVPSSNNEGECAVNNICNASEHVPSTNNEGECSVKNICNASEQVPSTNNGGECSVNNICNASEQVPSTNNEGDANPVEDCPCVNGNPFMHVMTEVTSDKTQPWKTRTYIVAAT